jgi:hypothetical protein
MKNDDRVFLTPEEAEERILSIASDLRRRYAGVAEVQIESEKDQYYSVNPINPKACSFSFILDQWLDIEPAGGRWELDWTDDGIRLFWRMVESIAAGRIVAYPGKFSTQVEITLDDGEVKRSTVMSGLFGLLARRSRKATTFEPW